MVRVRVSSKSRNKRRSHGAVQKWARERTQDELDVGALDSRQERDRGDILVPSGDVLDVC